MARRGGRNKYQLDLFADCADEVEAEPVPMHTVSGLGGKPDMVVTVLNETVDGRYGLLDATERVVEIDGENRCRYALDVEAVVESLRTQKYITTADTVSCRHGAILKPVTRLKVTATGRKLRARWTAFKPVI